MTILSTLLLTLAVVVLAVSLVIAQTNGENELLLLESGKAEKLADLPHAGELKIVSYNIRWRSGDELQKIIRWLKDAGDSRPAIIGLQEVDRAKKRSRNTNHPKAIAESLGMYYAWTAPPEAKPKSTKEEETGVAILSPYPLTDVTRIVLPHPGPGGRLRVAIGATAKIGETAVRIYSVHGEVRLTIGKKADQQKAVLEDLQKFPPEMPAIVVGDFNTWEMSAIDGIRKRFTNAGFTTPFPDDETTFRDKFVMFEVKFKLDWIWVRGLTPQSYGIDRKLTVSDHFPLWAEVRLPVDKPKF